MYRKSISLVPFFLADQEALVPPVAQAVERTFRCATEVRAPWFDPERAYDASRGQYNSRHLLAELLGEPGESGDRVLGITDVDLFIPVLTFVFGEAQLQGRAAVVSARRLRPESYGMPRDPARLSERLVQESIHELGHTFGLLHCDDATCVMRSSTVVEEIDDKSHRFCGRCRDQLRRDGP